MIRALSLIVAALAITCTLPVLAQAPTSSLERASAASGAAVDSLKTQQKSRTRFAIGLDRDVHFQVAVLTGPHRVVIELPQVEMQLPPRSPNPVGLVRSFVSGLSGPGRSRVVIDLTQPVMVENQRIEKSPDGKSYRLVLELVPADPKPPSNAGNATPTQSSPTTMAKRSSNWKNLWSAPCPQDFDSIWTTRSASIYPACS